jgi:hypothetical protein
MGTTPVKERVSTMPDTKQTKRVRISSKHQLTIPADFFEKAGFTDEAIVEYDAAGRRLIIKPVQNFDGYDFSEEILKDLVSQGLEGAELVKEFSLIKSQVPQASKKMLYDKIQEAKKAPIMTSDSSLDDYLDQLPDRKEDE